MFASPMIKRSPIIKKKCKVCNTKYPAIGLGGYCWSCVPEYIKEKLGTKRKVAQKNKNQRLALASKLRAVNEEINGESELKLWYIARHYDMTGICSEEGCLNSTNKHNDRYYRWSVCHIVPKGLIKSVATNFLNWVELCQDHHAEYDSNFDSASKMKCFPEIKRRFGLFKHLIPHDEMRKINPHLL